jgi:hypothetical protein
MKEPLELQDDVARALRMLGQAAPPEGMEARIVLRMRERQAELASNLAARRNPRRTRWIFASAVAVAAAAIVMLSWHHVRVALPRQVAVETPHHVTPQASAPVRTDLPVNTSRLRHRIYPVHAGILQAQVSAPSQNPPPLPLTRQEQLLLALAQTPRLPPALDSVTTSETIVDHGLGKNTIFELDHQEPQELTPLKTTLQLTQLKSTLPQPNLSGDIE